MIFYSNANMKLKEIFQNDILTILLTDIIFKAAFSSLSKYTQTDMENAKIILKYMTSFLQFGDIFRRLLSISLTEKIEFKKLTSQITDYNSEFNEALQTFCGKLITDFVFIQNFSKIGFDLIMDNSLSKQILITANHHMLTNI